MSRYLGSCLLTLVLGFIGLDVALAQGPAEQKPPATQPGSAPLPPRNEDKEKDPTQPSDQLKMLMMKSEDALPAITLVAKVVARNRPPLAIVRIGDRELLVSKNSTIELPKTIMKVVDINLDGLRLELQQAKLGSKTINLK